MSHDANPIIHTNKHFQSICTNDKQTRVATHTHTHTHTYTHTGTHTHTNRHTISLFFPRGRSACKESFYGLFKQASQLSVKIVLRIIGLAEDFLMIV